MRNFNIKKIAEEMSCGVKEVYRYTSDENNDFISFVVDNNIDKKDIYFIDYIDKDLLQRSELIYLNKKNNMLMIRNNGVTETLLEALREKLKISRKNFRYRFGRNKNNYRRQNIKTITAYIKEEIDKNKLFWIYKKRRGWLVKPTIDLNLNKFKGISCYFNTLEEAIEYRNMYVDELTEYLLN